MPAKEMVTRALRVGEGRKFRAYEKRVAAVNRFEAEMELLEDSEIRRTSPQPVSARGQGGGGAS